jgi:hypothetical protein
LCFETHAINGRQFYLLSSLSFLTLLIFQSVFMAYSHHERLFVS